MKVQITSYVHHLSYSKRLELTIDTINKSTSDILLFSGHTIGFVNDIDKLKSAIKNNKTEVIFELESINTDKIRNCIYHIKKGVIRSLYSNQIFAESIEINNNYELGDRLLNELENKRSIIINGLSVLIIQCGEINILKNIQKENNRVEFRLKDNQLLNQRFERIMHKTDIIFNPIHEPMGNQGKMHKRREFLSKNSKYYFSTSNSKPNSSNLFLNSMQYAYYDGKEIFEIERIKNENSLSRVYELTR